jgi:hypothetical protein
MPRYLVAEPGESHYDELHAPTEKAAAEDYVIARYRELGAPHTVHVHTREPNSGHEHQWQVVVHHRPEAAATLITPPKP